MTAKERQLRQNLTGKTTGYLTAKIVEMDRKAHEDAEATRAIASENGHFRQELERLHRVIASYDEKLQERNEKIKALTDSRDGWKSAWDDLCKKREEMRQWLQKAEDRLKEMAEHSKQLEAGRRSWKESSDTHLRMVIVLNQLLAGGRVTIRTDSIDEEIQACLKSTTQGSSQPSETKP